MAEQGRLCSAPTVYGEPCGLQAGHNMGSVDIPENHRSGRPDWVDYFLGIAQAVSARADCTRRKVGAVVVKDNRIVSTGYNGAHSGGPSCLAGECPRGLSGVEPGSSYDTGAGACIANHAEANAIIYAGRDSCVGSTIYLTTGPCDGCLRLIRGAGIAMVIWPSGIMTFSTG